MAHLMDLPKGQRIRIDIILAVAICLIGRFVYSNSFTDWKQCTALKKEYITNRGDYYDLSCDKVLNEKLDATAGFTLFGEKSWYEKNERNEKTKVESKNNQQNQNQNLTKSEKSYVVFVFLSYILVYSLSAFVQAAQLHLYMIAFLVFLSPWILIILVGSRSLLPVTLVTFLVTYSLIISKLYGYYFNLFAVLGSFLSFIATVWLILIVIVFSFISKAMN